MVPGHSHRSEKRHTGTYSIAVTFGTSRNQSQWGGNPFAPLEAISCEDRWGSVPMLSCRLRAFFLETGVCIIINLRRWHSVFGNIFVLTPPPPIMKGHPPCLLHAPEWKSAPGPPENGLNRSTPRFKGNLKGKWKKNVDQWLNRGPPPRVQKNVPHIVQVGPLLGVSDFRRVVFL